MSVDTPAQAGRQHRRIAGGERAACSPPGRLVGPLSAACYFPDPGDPGGGEGQHSLSQYDGRCPPGLRSAAVEAPLANAGSSGAMAATGPEALWCVAHPASEIKAMCSTLEQSHPLGRLWDIDVICPQNGLVGRQSLGESQRRCLLCDEPAHACARSRRHDTDLVVARVEQMIDAWFARD